MSEKTTPQLLYEGGGKTIHLERYVSEEVIQFLDTIKFGYKETTLHHKNTRDIILKMSDPHVMTSRIDGQLVMTCLFSKRILHVQGKPIDAFYVRYLASDDKLHGQGTIVKIGLLAIAYLRKSRTNPTVFYSFVEESHRSSYRFIQFMKFHQFANIKTIGFSRVFPRLSKGVEKIKDIKSRNDVVEIITDKFKDYPTFCTDEYLNYGEHYILKEEGEIVAVLRTNNANWVLNSLPGITGTIALKVVPYIPFLNRLVNPSDWHFFGVDSMYSKDNNPDYIIKLLSSVLKMTGLHASLMWLDENDPLANQLIESKNLGLVYHFAKSSNTKSMISFQGLTEEEEAYFKNNLVYVSALDNI